jgi:hypothetical protein
MFMATVRSHASGLSTPRSTAGRATALANASCTASCASAKSAVSAYTCATSLPTEAA